MRVNDFSFFSSVIFKSDPFRFFVSSLTSVNFTATQLASPRPRPDFKAVRKYHRVERCTLLSSHSPLFFIKIFSKTFFPKNNDVPRSERNWQSKSFINRQWRVRRNLSTSKIFFSFFRRSRPSTPERSILYDLLTTGASKAPGNSSASQAAFKNTLGKNFLFILF